MLKHIIFFLVGVFVLSLSAAPNISQIKQAVQANPALLNTPQAKAIMAQKGVSASEVKAKLEVDSSAELNTEVTSEDIKNDLSVDSDDDKKANVKVIETVLAKRVNPFKFSSNKALREELNKKQQALVKNKLSRYSMKFYTNKNKIDTASLPTPDDYILSSGDILTIYIYGDRNKVYSAVIKNDGNIELPYIGPVKVGGMKYIEAKKHLIKNLKSHFRLSDFNINISKYSTIQVTLVGDVKNPGLYNVSSFSTVKDLLIVAKGTRETASVRNLTINRNGKIIANLDFYDLLFKGKAFAKTLLKHGDIVVVKRAKKLVSIDGYVNNAAIFELKGDEKLNTLIRYAGGMKPDASKTDIKIKRYSDNFNIETFNISYKDAKNFEMKDGDKVYIYPLDFTANSSINIYGNVIRPGSYRLKGYKTLNEFFKKTIKGGSKKFFLPQVCFSYGVIKRYSTSLTYETKSFDLQKVLEGKEDIEIKPQDEVYIFSQNDIYSNSYVVAKGKSLIRSGKLQFYVGMTIKDAVNAAGIDAVMDDKVRLTTYNTDDLMPKTLFYSLQKDGNVTLSPYDEIEVFGYYDTHVLEPVTISGEVIKPKSVYYENGMNAKELISMAGGFNKKAYTKRLTIIRHYIDKDQVRQQKVLNYDLDKTPLEDIAIKPYDEVKVLKILGWDAQDYETVTIGGEVRKPLSIKYGEGMSVADLIILAGGLTKKAYKNEIELVRYYLDENEARRRHIIKIDTKETDYNDIKLKAYDEVRIFKIPKWDERKVVKIAGQVKFPGFYTIETGEKLSSLIKRAGGFTDEAFIKGAVFTRESVKKNQIDQYNKTLARIKRELAIFNAMPANTRNNSSSTSNPTATLNEVISEAKKYQPIGRISIELDQNITKIENSDYDLVLQDKDTLTIPSKIDTVTVFGEVFNPTSFVYRDDVDAEGYIELASGFARGADENRVYIIHADGTSEPAVKGWWIFKSYTTIAKGDTIVVPMYIKEYNQLDLWESVSKILASFAVTGATLHTLGVL